MTVFKMPNWNGLELACNCCGKTIKNHYSVKGIEGIYGLDCAWAIVNNNEIKDLRISKLIKEIESLENFVPLSFLSESDKEVSRKSNLENINVKLAEIESIRYRK